MKTGQTALHSLFAVAALFAGCRSDTQTKAKATAEHAGETIEMAARDVADTVEKAAPKAKASLEHAGEKIEETAEAAAQGAKDLTNKAAKRTEEATRTPSPTEASDDLTPSERPR